MSASVALTHGFFGHPRGLATLFFTEMWERFSYYGMRAILILFMTAGRDVGGLGWSVADAGAVYGIYTGCVYLACLPGGWLADRLLGQRRATLIGACIIVLGHLSLAFPSVTSFYIGLALLVVGTGLLKPNISALVGQLYPVQDPRRDAGFSLYYMGINLGAFFAPLVCGWLAQSAGFRAFLSARGIDPALSWHIGFSMAAIGMVAGIAHFLHGARHLGEAGRQPSTGQDLQARRTAWRQLNRAAAVGLTVLAAVSAAVLSGWLELGATSLGDLFGVLLLLTTVGFFAWLFLAGTWTSDERRRLLMILVLFLGATAFWSLYEQGGSTLNLFAERNTDTTAFGFDFPASWMLSLNPILIIGGLAPAFAWLWLKLGPREPSSAAKFALGLLFMALGYVVMIGAAKAAAGGNLVSPWWLVAMYVLHTIGEMCLSPVGLSAMTRLAPQRIAGLTMGVWFLASSIGSYLGGRVAGFYETLSLVQIFGALTIFALVSTCLMAALIKPYRRALDL